MTQEQITGTEYDTAKPELEGDSPLDFFAEYSTDEAAEENGRWFDFDGDKGIRFKIAMIENAQYKKLLNALMKPHRDIMARNSKYKIPQKIQDDIKNKLYAKTILKGWEGVYSQGEPLPYNEKNAVKLVNMLDVVRFIDAICDNTNNFREQQKEEIAGN